MIRIIKLAVLSLYVILSQDSSWGAKKPDVFLSERSGPHIERIIGINAAEFQKSSLRRLAAQFVKDVAKGHITGTLWIVTSRLDSERLQGVRATDQSYAAWRQSWMREYRLTFAVGRVSVVSGHARLDVRWPNGMIEREIVSGGDPFIVSSGSGVLEVIYLFVREVRGVRGEGPIIGYSYNVMLCSRDPLPAAIVVSHIRELSRRIKSNRIQARVQANSWFRHANLPVVYPFEAPAIPPMTLEDASPYESWCEMVEARIECNISR